jgi:SWI/SNF-related matrix-associated actin-dependent regulator of chromatin subfamily A-like protein 1
MAAPTLDTAAADFLIAAAERVTDGYPDLFRHQATGVAFLLSRRRAILADDMGLGKTRTAIVAAREQSSEGRVLIICPASMKHGWRREIAVIEPDAHVEVVGSEPPSTAGRWTVVNYDRLARHVEWLTQLLPDVVIVDEAHFIKNRSARSNRTLSLISANPDAAVYLLTGTPMTNRPRDLFNLLKAVEHPAARSFYSFAQRYCAAHDNGYGLQTDGASNVEELAQVTSGVMLRRTKDEVLDLPEKVRTWLPVEVGSDRVRELEMQALAYLAANPDRDGPTWVKFLGLLNKARHQLATAKAPETARFVADLVEGGQKVVVFTSYQSAVDRMMKAFDGRAVALTGSHSSEERDAAVQRFQDDESVRVFVGNLKAAGTGITLTAGTHVVFNDLDWVPANHWQAEDRIHRIGQTQPTFATYLSAPGTLDEFVAQLLEAKAALVGVVEREAEARSTMVADLVDAALDGVDPYASAPARVEARHTVGLLEETLELLRQFAPPGLTAIQQGVSVHTFPSSSSPGTSYTVEVANGVARCDCPGFSYRGNCKHSREALAKG